MMGRAKFNFITVIGIQGKWKMFKEKVMKALETCFGNVDKIPYKLWIIEDIINMWKRE